MKLGTGFALKGFSEGTLERPRRIDVCWELAPSRSEEAAAAVPVAAAAVAAAAVAAARKTHQVKRKRAVRKPDSENRKARDGWTASAWGTKHAGLSAR